MNLTIICILNMDQSSLKKLKHITQLFKTVQFAIPRSVNHELLHRIAQTHNYIGHQGILK